MYAPNEEWGGQYNEWIELYNKDDKTINLAGWEIDGKEIPDGTIIQPQGYLIIARNDTSFAEIYPGAVCSVVKVSIELNNDGEELFLKDSAGNVVDSVNYTSYANKKLGKKNGKTLERNETAWEESIRNGGTPCQRNSVLPPTSFVINGYVFYEDNTACNNPAVKITNDKIGEWFAENSTDSNYYMLTLKSTAEVMAGDTLRIDASSPDGTQINVTTFVVTQADIDEGSVQINITLEQPKLNEIKVTPQSAVVTVNTTKEFIATAYDQYGNPLEGVFIYWTSTNKTVGTVSPALPNML
nr:lamin tail domain-containing protein [Methanophagales archaeon]